MEREVADLMQGDRLNIYSLGVYLGNNWNEEQKKLANLQGIKLFEHFDVIPSRGAMIPCVSNGCHSDMTALEDASRSIGWRFRCAENHRANPLSNTFLERANLREIGADKIVKLIFSWITELPIMKAIQDIGVSTKTGIAWYQYCREVAAKIAWHNYQQIGGANDIVEVDETHLFKSKYNVGRAVMWQHHWVFGGISRTTKKRFAQLVDDRTTETLLPIMQNFIDVDSFICSDEWRAYRACAQAFSGHGAVNHAINFLNPPNDAPPLWFPTGRFSQECLSPFNGAAPGPNLDPVRYHTQNIERAWRGLKEVMKSCNELFYAPHYIGEWMYRENHMKGQTLQNQFIMFLRDIQRAHPGINKTKMSLDLTDCNCHECQP